jgi:hypothetical protein
LLFTFKFFKWKSQAIFRILNEDVLKFSLQELLITYQDYVTEVLIEWKDGTSKIFMQLTKSDFLFPRTPSKMYRDFSMQELLIDKKPIQLNLKIKNTKARYVYSELNSIDFGESDFNLKLFKSITSQIKNKSPLFVTYKLKKVNSETLTSKYVKINGLIIVDHNFGLDEDYYIVSIGIITSKSLLGQIKSIFSNDDMFEILKQKSIYLLTTQEIHRINFAVIEWTKHINEKINDPGLSRDNGNIPQSEIMIGTGKISGNGKFNIKLSDIKQGGIISGAIGTGKTTLRLNLMEQLIANQISIIDIDYKGDAPRLYRFNSKGLVLIPGKNLHIDIFNQPSDVNTIEFVGILYRSFIESITDGELTPPQKQILYEALRKTVTKKGNLETFYRNIIIASVESKEIIDNYQNHTAIALINKFNWLQTTMRNVFGVEGQSISGKDLASENIFIDLSYIQHSAPNNHIRFFLDILITKLMLYYKSKDSENFNISEFPLKKVIFIDETHMIMPNHKMEKLSRLEELVVTMRHKGLSVVATTTNSSLISNVFLDSSFQARFRTDSSFIERSMGDKNIEYTPILQLQNYSYYLKSSSTDHQPLLIKTNQFVDNSLSNSEYYSTLHYHNVNYLNEFIIEAGIFEAALLESIVFKSLPIEPYRKIVRPIAMQYLQSNFDLLEKISKEKAYHEFILTSFSDFMKNNETNIPEFRDKYYLSCFLTELLIYLFRYIFYRYSLEKVTKSKEFRDFQNRFKVIFLNLIVFIDEFLENYFKSEEVVY